MPPKPRQVRMESKSALNAMQQLESRSDEELEKETRFKAAAQAILGTRAAERMDAAKSREHFRAAIAASRPQERLQLRRMAEASLALAERRAGDLKVATEKLGGTPPTNRQLLMLRVMGVIAPPPVRRPAAPDRRRPARDPGDRAGDRGRLGHRQPDRAPDRLGSGNTAWFYGFLLVVVVLGVLAFVGRRRQRTARAKAAEQRAAAYGGKR